MADGTFQTLTLEYRVYGECDGTTVAPAFSDGEIDARQIVVFEVENLGIIPLRFDEEPNPDDPSTPANRFVTWTVLYGEQSAVNFDSGLSVAAQIENLGYQPIEPQGQIAAGKEGAYIQRCIKVPQGGVLMVKDIVPSGGRPAVVRLRVQQTDNSEQNAMLENACCCKAAQVTISLPDEPNGDCPADLTLTGVTPSSTLSGLGAVSVTLSGSGFSELASPGLAFSREDGTGGTIQLPTANLQVLDDNTITVDVTPNVPGLYDVFVGDTSSQNCFAALLQSFTVLNPG